VNKEYAIGAASLTDYFVVPHEGVPESYFRNEVKQVQERLKMMHKRFLDGREPENLEGKTVIVVDDGIATGNTLLATISIFGKVTLLK
jgi:putative phosphoribosyl transferase